MRLRGGVGLTGPPLFAFLGQRGRHGGLGSIQGVWGGDGGLDRSSHLGDMAFQGGFYVVGFQFVIRDASQQVRMRRHVLVGRHKHF